MADLVVKSKIKETVKLRVSGSVAEALNKKVEQILKDAEARAVANKRGTVMAQDL